MSNNLKIVEEVKDILKQVRKAYGGLIVEGTDIGELIEKMGEKAHQLHLVMKEQGNEPRHHGYMVKNRGMKPDHKEFYHHVHPVEDLLAFIENPNANDDPEDQTIGNEFTLTVYSRRWGHDDTYELTRTQTGWDVSHTHEGPCDKAGQPFLYSNFENDSVHYPAGLRDYFEWLWTQAAEQGLSHECVQEALEELAKWIDATSRSAPSGGIWKGL